MFISISPDGKLTFYHSYPEIPKYSDTRKYAVIILNLNNVADGMVSSVDPDQTLTWVYSLIWVYTVFRDLSVLKLRIITVCHLQKESHYLGDLHFKVMYGCVVVVVVEVQAILRPPRSGALALPHNGT